MTKKILISLAVAAALILGVLYGKGLLNVHQADHPPASLQALTLQKSPKPAPPISFSDASGARYGLAAFKGRYVLVNMWATYCAPCVAELPALARLKASVPGLTVLAVDLGHDKANVAGAFLKAHQAAALPALVDDKITMMAAFRVFALPTTVLIDPKGQVIARAEGAAKWDAPESVDYFKQLTGS